jgi:glycosyltransferase involved in cell wall biosynthesis
MSGKAAMNILFIHEVDWLKKVVFDLHFLAEGLSLRGNRVYAIDYEDTWKRDGPFDFGTLGTRTFTAISRAYKGSSVDVIRPGFIKLPGIGRATAVCTHAREIRRTIKNKAIDAVVLYSVPTNGLRAISAARSAGIPVIFRSIDVLSTLVPYPVLKQMTAAMEKRVARTADLIVPNTSQYGKRIIDMGIPESQIKYVPSPVDTSIFKPGVDTSAIKAKWGITEDDQLVVFIGTLFNFCGLDEFIKAFPKVTAAHPKAKLLIVGDGPMKPRLDQIINELNLRERVIITGFQPYATMPEYINAATVCINTFLVRPETMDVFPAKITQYAACGKPTAATALRGITTILSGESEGVVYGIDPAEVTQSVVELLGSPQRRDIIGSAGLAKIRASYSPQEVAAQLEDILRGLVDGKRK